MFWKQILVSGAAAVLVFGWGISAHAASGIESEPITVEMDVLGYDESVAAANGFDIVTYPDGSWEAVAVTPKAKKLQAKWGGSERQVPQAPDGDVSAQRVTVYGNCGSSWIEVLNSGSVKRVNTGYSVKAPVTNRTLWRVQVTSFGGLPSMTWPSGPSGATWSGTSTFSTGGFGGQAFVTTGSSVILITGAVCGSGSPAQGY